MDWIFLIGMSVIGVVPTLVSICYLLPKVRWSTRFKVLLSRGLLKFPFGVLFGFLGVALIKILTMNVIPSKVLWVATSLGIYLSLIWLYLFLYKMMLNKLFKLAISWSAIINSILIELGLLGLMVTIAVGIAMTLNLSLPM